MYYLLAKSKLVEGCPGTNHKIDNLIFPIKIAKKEDTHRIRMGLCRGISPTPCSLLVRKPADLL